eukprot:scaffold68129_cov45-Phaeocystis_antarctica.AAC.1
MDLGISEQGVKAKEVRQRTNLCATAPIYVPLHQCANAPMRQCTNAPMRQLTLYGYESHDYANPNPNPAPNPNQVVTLYGYESHDYVQPSTYPLESVTPTNVDIAITETGAGAQK